MRGHLVLNVLPYLCSMNNIETNKSENNFFKCNKQKVK